MGAVVGTIAIIAVFGLLFSLLLRKVGRAAGDRADALAAARRARDAQRLAESLGYPSPYDAVQARGQEWWDAQRGV